MIFVPVLNKLYYGFKGYGAYACDIKDFKISSKKEKLDSVIPAIKVINEITKKTTKNIPFNFDIFS